MSKVEPTQDKDEAEFNREVLAMARRIPGWLKRTECHLPIATRAFCAGCKREISWDEYGLVAYERRCWHHDCLEKELIHRTERMLTKPERKGRDYEMLAEAEEALGALGEENGV